MERMLTRGDTHALALLIVCRKGEQVKHGPRRVKFQGIDFLPASLTACLAPLAPFLPRSLACSLALSLNPAARATLASLHSAFG